MGLLYEELSYALRGMFFKIYNEIDPRFKEETYVRALLKLLDEKKIPYQREKQFDINFKTQKLAQQKST